MIFRANHSAVMKRMRVDVSTLLLIAFVFQLVWPIAAFASDAIADEYEAALRNSICQVVLEEAQQDKAPEVQDIVCDWCVLCGTPFDITPKTDALVLSQRVFLDDVLIYCENSGLVQQVYSYLSAPRAPPIS